MPYYFSDAFISAVLIAAIVLFDPEIGRRLSAGTRRLGLRGVG